MFTPLTLLASFLANLLPTAPLYAMQADDNKVELEGGTTWTAVSGDTGNAEVILGRKGDFHASYAITWWEDSDDPCKFELATRHMNLGGTEGPEAEWCNDSAGNVKAVTRWAADQYITALQICRTDKNDETQNKIKGLRVWGRVVDKRNATLGSEAGPDEDQHTHCAVWENKVSCPTGHVANRIKVHYQKYWSNRHDQWYDFGWATGISLGCRKVVDKDVVWDGTVIADDTLPRP